MPATREAVLVATIVLLLGVLFRDQWDRAGRMVTPPAVSTSRRDADDAGITEDVHHVCRHHLAKNLDRTSQVYCPAQPDVLNIGDEWVSSRSSG